MFARFKRDCTDCGEAIPEKRLRAVLNARRCVVCQESYDLDPTEAIDSELLAKGMAVGSELDGEMNGLAGRIA